ncbi:MAG: glycosyltransferase [Comamonadaceae bacterium]|nr:glycosyltransferase [Comamonadaceae bacterium]
MPICNEDIATVFGGLRATCESLAATGALRAVRLLRAVRHRATPTLREAELRRLGSVCARCWATPRSTAATASSTAGARRRTKRKAGNVADFCRRWGRDYRYMVVLDADSTMSGDALVALVRLMEANPRAGIVQTLPRRARPATRCTRRVQQFASRVTGPPVRARHGVLAARRVALLGPQRDHPRRRPSCSTARWRRFPGRGGPGRRDPVARLRRGRADAPRRLRGLARAAARRQLGAATRRTCSTELQRDRRWCQGNLQNARLIAEPGLAPGAPRDVRHRRAVVRRSRRCGWLFVVLGALLDGPAIGGATAVSLWVLTALLLLMPRVLGVLAVLAQGDARRFGGTPALLASAVIELFASAIQAPLRMLAHTSFVLGALTGLKLEWKSPPRTAGSVAWRDAAVSIGLLALPALALAVIGQGSGEIAAWHLLPLLLPLALAVPFTVLTGSEAIGRAVRRAGLLLTPEDREPPRPVTRAAENRSFADLVPRPVVDATRSAARGAAAAMERPRAVVALGAAAVAAMMLLPQPGVTPELSPAMRAEREIVALVRAMPISVPTVRVEPRPVRVRLDANYRPAARIDDDVRRRALDAVQRAQGPQDYESFVRSLAKAAAIAP